MKLFTVSCQQCKKVFYRSKSRINEGKKFDWKIYCSSICASKGKNKQQLQKCSNPKCNRNFKRSLRDIKKVNKVFCSRSCATSVNNSKFPKRPAVKKCCILCNKEFISREKYCSKACKNKSQIINKDKVLIKIKEFYKINGRIPLKREFQHAKAARDRFGSWNNAIKASGFNPNPVKFAKKFIANDGHKCDSLAEKIIDDWLFARKIVHQRSMPYNKNRMTADFKINDTFIEFFGLKGQIKSYDRLIKEKRRLWQEKDLKVIEI